jgi:3-hydroxymyristoyl/3-hydroxydecanoyl-(acyl carrier protein) dehydratase
MHADHPALAGHFPGRPIVPGVMLLSAVLDYAQLQFGNELRIDGIDQTKFINALLPNQEAQLTITRQAKRLKFSIELGGTLIAQGSLTVAESVSLTTP